MFGAVLASVLAACGGGHTEAPSYCSHISATPIDSADPALVTSVRAVKRHGFHLDYVASRSRASVVSTLVPGPAPGLKGVATNACSAETPQRGVVVLMTFDTSHHANAWFNGPARDWTHAVAIAGVPDRASDPHRGVVMGSSCRAVGIYENLATPVRIASEYDHLPEASKRDVLSDPSVGMRVLPPQFACQSS